MTRSASLSRLAALTLSALMTLPGTTAVADDAGNQCIAPISYLPLDPAMVGRGDNGVAALGTYERVSPDGRYILRSYSGAQLGRVSIMELPATGTGMQMREPERFVDFTSTVFNAIWVRQLNMNDPQVVIEALAAAGYAPELVQGLMNDAEVKARLKAVTEEAVARGVFGAPTVFVGEEMFFGQDRLDWVREALGGVPKA